MSARPATASPRGVSPDGHHRALASLASSTYRMAALCLTHPVIRIRRTRLPQLAGHGVEVERAQLDGIEHEAVQVPGQDGRLRRLVGPDGRWVHPTGDLL